MSRVGIFLGCALLTSCLGWIGLGWWGVALVGVFELWIASLWLITAA